jgi:hypothetical protein
LQLKKLKFLYCHCASNGNQPKAVRQFGKFLGLLAGKILRLIGLIDVRNRQAA